MGKAEVAPPEGGFRCGFAALLGRPNVGKSTLLNRILGQKIAITSPKPQTTRTRITGILTTASAQTIFLDTPGLHQPVTPLNRKMVKEAHTAAAGADVLVMIIEAHAPWRDEDLITLELLEKRQAPKILVINKIDKVIKDNLLPLIDRSARLASFDEIVPLSALKGDNVDRFVQVVQQYLPSGPALFPPDMVTDQAERFWAAEIVREKVVRWTRDELPYATAVRVEEFEEKPELLRIRAVIVVERESQKGIVIGRQGAMLKQIGTSARRDLERFLGVKVYLELFVRVEKEWWKKGEER